MQPIRFKALAAIVSICLLGLISIGSSLWFATATESDAAAINVSGSLRMQSWRLSEQVLVPELTSEESLARLIEIFDHSINRPSLSKLAGRNDELGRSYAALLEEWSGHMRPLLLDPGTRVEFIENVPGFVDRIDSLVNALQQNTENKLRILFVIAVLMLCGIVCIGIFSIRFIRLNLFMPIGDLSRAAEKVSGGDFNDLELTYRGNNELGQLTRTFSGMSRDLSRLYDNLEEQVSRQTRSLEQSNTALQLLYEASQTLGVNPYDERELRHLLDRWKQLLELDSCYVCLTANTGNPRLQSVCPEGDSLDGICNKGECIQCIRHPNSDWQFALQLKEQQFGYLQVITRSGKRLSDESRQWLKTFCDMVATSLYRSSSENNERRLLLIEERSVIARELHDSLAQALSYQKIQVVRLRRQLVKLGVDESVDSVVEELREGINSAYRQLRELLNTFRLNMSEGSLEDALANTLREYRKRAENIDFQLDYQLRFCSIHAHHQIHVLQIVREALVNIIQHAGASAAKVSCSQLPEGRVQVIIDDDGRGFNSIDDKGGRAHPGRSSDRSYGHYGTTIMEERAASLDGQLSFCRSPLGGARVNLEFAAA
ncbi:MAG: type IV pili methyl-accepting chemotaxis transducer N-terminal domain-containing protein [Endozoicomonas sp.]